MNAFRLCGWETKGLASTGGVVSPSSRKKRPLIELTLKDTKKNGNDKKTTLH